MLAGGGGCSDGKGEGSKAESNPIVIKDNDKSPQTDEECIQAAQEELSTCLLEHIQNFGTQHWHHKKQVPWPIRVLQTLG